MLESVETVEAGGIISRENKAGLNGADPARQFSARALCQEPHERGSCSDSHKQLSQNLSINVLSYDVRVSLSAFSNTALTYSAATSSM